MDDSQRIGQLISSTMEQCKTGGGLTLRAFMYELGYALYESRLIHSELVSPETLASVFVDGFSDSEFDTISEEELETA